MKAAVIREFGRLPELADFPEPEPRAGQVVLDVEAAGMNPVEIAIASGAFYGPRPALPMIAGREGVGRRRDGRRAVFGACIAPYGSFATQALVDEEVLVEIPDDIDGATAVALWTAGLAALLPLERMARLRPGESVLVLGASGVVGQLALQLARLMRAGRVVAAARSQAGLERSAELGADGVVTIDDAFRDSLRGASERGYDVILDLLWAEPAEVALDALAPWGRMVQVGSAAGTNIALSAATMRSRNATVMGYTTAQVPQPERVQAYERLVAHARAGRLEIESERFSLDRIAEAWTRQQQGPHRKIIVVP
jgi:NADPH2:quinone reductase